MRAMKHLLKLMDLTAEEIIGILNLADQLKYERRNRIPHPRLAGKTLGMIFQKNSTRTRVSFEVGMYELGGSALFLSSRELQIGRGEPVEDTARVLSRYLDGIMIRTSKQSEVEGLAKYGSIPVINGLTDYCHPCQVLADLMTVREYKGSFRGLKIAYIGDGNNVANSLIAGGAKLGMRVAVACPRSYSPAREVTDWASAQGLYTQYSSENARQNVLSAAEDADVICTDVWASMGQEEEAAIRRQAFKGYCIDDEVMEAAKADCMVQHCLPAHREEEITSQVFEAHAGEIFDEAENRLHAQKALMVKLMGDDK